MQDIKDRFLDKVMYTDSCWIWTAATLHNGYGCFRTDYRTESAHRVAWQLFRGPIPDDMHVLHKCDVRCCVNPSHLFLGTNADNIRDRNAKGRYPRTIRRRLRNGVGDVPNTVSV